MGGSTEVGPGLLCTGGDGVQLYGAHLGQVLGWAPGCGSLISVVGIVVSRTFKAPHFPFQRNPPQTLRCESTVLVN